MKFIDNLLLKLGYAKTSTWGQLFNTAKEMNMLGKGNGTIDPYAKHTNVYKPVKAIADSIQPIVIKLFEYLSSIISPSMPLSIAF